MSKRRALDDRELARLVRAPLRLGLLVVGGLVAAGIAWAALAELDAAAVAPGTLKPEGERRMVQNLEGGRVAALHVREDQEVAAGALLVELDATQARAQVAVLEARAVEREAALARLDAQRQGLEALRFPAELSARAARLGLEPALAAQAAMFEAQRAAYRANRDLVAQRRAVVRTQMEGAKRAVAARGREKAALRERHAGLIQLADSGAGPRAHVLAIEAQLGEVDAVIAAGEAELARTGHGLAEVELDLARLRAEWLDRAEAEHGPLRAELDETLEQLVVARDVLARRRVTAPVAGRVIDLQVTTLGAVLQPGAPILGLVPAEDRLVVEARLSPLDVDRVAPGQPARLVLSFLPLRAQPQLLGAVLAVAADRTVVEATGEAFYAVTVAVPPEELARAGLAAGGLVAGMPVEVLVRTGRRTVLDYLLEPLGGVMRRAMRDA